MYKSSIILFLALIFVSCGKKEEKIENAVIRANLALTRGDCQSAIEILEIEGPQPNNLTYIKALASAYGCKAGYKTTTLFGNDIAKVTTPERLFTNFSTFTTSPNDEVDNEAYVYLQRALDTLLYAGGTSKTRNPTSMNRDLLFGSKGKEINSFALYLSLAQLGKFTYFFGNSSPATGVKGGGGVTSSNPCYLDYNGNVNTFIGNLNTASPGSTGACVSGSNEGHPDLVSGVDTVDLANACSGIVLFNNFIDTLDNFLAVFTGNTFSQFVNISAAVQVAKNGIVAVKGTFDTRIFDTTSQAKCEDLFAGNDEDIMYFYAAVFETLHR